MHCIPRLNIPTDKKEQAIVCNITKAFILYIKMHGWWWMLNFWAIRVNELESVGLLPFKNKYIYVLL